MTDIENTEELMEEALRKADGDAEHMIVSSEGDQVYVKDDEKLIDELVEVTEIRDYMTGEESLKVKLKTDINSG